WRATQCGSCPNGTVGSGRKSAAHPSLRGSQPAPPSVDSNTPPPESARYRCRGSRGSMLIECVSCPSGVPKLAHFEYMGLSLKPATGCQRSPPSSERKRPAGDVPAYQVPRSDECPGVSQNTRCTARASSPLAACRKAGGCAASFQVRPRSVERKTVGPRCPVLAAINRTFGWRGSCTT